MNDMDDDDLSNISEDEDGIKPIDIGGTPPRQVPQDMPPFESSPQVSGDHIGEDQQKPFLQDTPETASSGGEKPVYIHRGEYVDLIEKIPALKRIVIGAGWDQLSPEAELVDVDLSLFLCDKTDQTRIDEDFIFYNNERACDGAVHHLSDSRTGAGAGDDEEVFVDLNGLPFDIIKIVCVLSIYDPEIKGHNFSMIKNLYIRFVNKDDGQEIFRYAPAPEDCQGGTAMTIGVLMREGPRWIYEATAETTNGGLAKIATDYGLIIREMQSSLDVDDDSIL